MAIILPTGLTEKPDRVTATVAALTVSVWLAALAQLVFLSRHDFAPAAKGLWFEVWGYDPSQPSLWKAFSSLLVHADFWHGIVNIAGLWLFGWFVESAMEWKRFSVLSLLAHLLALKAQSLFWLWRGQNEISHLVGSSAIVAFSMGAFCVRFSHVSVKWALFNGWRWRRREFLTPLWWLIVPWLFWQVRALFPPNSDDPAIAHLTSFSFGFVTAMALGWHRIALCERWRREAELAEKEGRWLDAAEIWTQIARRMPTPSAWLAASHNFLMANEILKAQRALEKSLGQLVWDERALRRARQIASETLSRNLPAETVFALAEQLERHRCYREALELFKRVAEVIEFSKAPRALLKVVELHWRLGDEVKARQALHLFWLRYGQTHWGREAADLAAQILSER